MTVFESLPISTLQKMPAEEFPDDLTKVSLLEKSFRFFRIPSQYRPGILVASYGTAMGVLFESSV
jgi:hypothetical protein